MPVRSDLKRATVALCVLSFLGYLYAASQQGSRISTPWAGYTQSIYAEKLHQTFFGPKPVPRRTAGPPLPLANFTVDPRCSHGFNIFVYDLQGETTGQKFLQYILQHRGPFCQDDCNDAQFASEVQFWRYLLKSPCRVTDPEKAHLFYIPYLETLQWLSAIKPEKAFDVLYGALANHEYAGLEEVHGMTSKYLERHHGLDHVITFATPPFGEHILTASIPRIDYALITSIIPEIHKELLDHKQAIGAENVIVVPYPVFNQPWIPIRKSKPPQNRRFLASGLYGLHGDGERVRRTLIQMATALRDSSKFVGRLLFAEYVPAELRPAGNKEFGSTKLLYDSTFCLVPAGDSLSTRRLFNAMFAGCIPVVFGDELVLPFHRLDLPYDEFLLRLPLSYVKTAVDGPKLFGLLFDLQSSGKAAEMQQALFKHAPRLAFTLPFDEVPTFPLDDRIEDLQTGHDAFDALMAELKLRAHEIEAQKRLLSH